MSLLEKIVDILLSKSWVLSLISFVTSVVVSVFVPTQLYDKLPFDTKTNVIIGFAAITVGIFLILYALVCVIDKKYSKTMLEQEYRKIKNQETEESIEEWRCFFDKIPDEEYSIIMYFMITENKRPYKSWGYHCGSYGTSIFDFMMEDQLFYKTKSYEESPPYSVHFANENNPRMITSKGEATVYTLKENVYQTLKEIIKSKGSLSHHPRKTYKLDYGNGSDLPEFQESKFK